MAEYINRTKGPIGLTLQSGKTAVVPPRRSVEIAPEDEGSPALLAYVRKGVLTRSPLSVLPVAAPPSPPALSASGAVSSSSGEPKAADEDE